jgi:hypothetical protein
VNSGTIGRIPDKEIVKELNQHWIVVDLGLLLGREKFLTGRSDTNEETYPILIVKEKLSGQQLVQQTAQTPNIAGATGSDFLSTIIGATSLLTGIGHCQHLWTLGELSTSVTCSVSINLRAKDLRLTKVCQTDTEIGYVVSWVPKVLFIVQTPILLTQWLNEEIVAFDVKVVDIVLTQELERVQNVHVDVEIQGKIGSNGWRLSGTPLFQTALVALHDNPVVILVRSILKRVTDTTIILESIQNENL